MIVGVSLESISTDCTYVKLEGGQCGARSSFEPAACTIYSTGLLALPECQACGATETVSVAPPEVAGPGSTSFPGFDISGGNHTPAARQLIYVQAILACLMGHDPQSVLASYHISD